MPFIDRNGIDLSEYMDFQKGLTSLCYELLSRFFPDVKIMLINAGELSDKIATIAYEQQANLLIVDMSNHGYSIPNDLINDLSNKVPCPLYFLSSNLEYHYADHNDVIFFPYWLFSAQTFPKNNLVFGSLADINRKYKIVTTARNLKHRLHRIFFYGKLLQSTVDIRKNFFKFDDFDFDFDDYNAGLTHDEWQKFKNIYDSSPKFLESETNAVIDTNFDIYTEGYVHIVNETYVEYSFISEKSYKPFLAGQIPMVIGCANIMQMLKDLGFDIFEDIIDHKHYDSHENYHDRVAKMLELIEHVHTLEFDKIFDNTVDRRRKNLELVRNNNFVDCVVQKIIKKLGNSFN